jgi:retinol dehydrogenase-12
MALLRIEITSTDEEGVNIDVFSGEDGAQIAKQLRKSHESIASLYGLVTKWHKDKSFPSPPNPNGFFSPPASVAQQGIQEFFNAIVKEIPDSFACKSFFRLYDLQGKVVIITGASSGIGKQNAFQLAEMGAHLILACRSESKTLPIIDKIKNETGNENIEFLPLDLISLQSVNDFAEAFKAKNLPLHLLINNAGAVIEGLTDYGVDSTFGGCHVGPFLLTMRLLDILKQTENSRVILVASMAAGKAQGLPWDRIRSKIKLGLTNPMESYSYAKLANVAAAKTLSEKIKVEEGNNPLVFSLHPGVVGTDIWRGMPTAVSYVIKRFMLHEEEGSMMTLYLAVDKGCVEHSGLYFDYMNGPNPASPIPLAENEDLRKENWNETCKMCGLAQ